MQSNVTTSAMRKPLPRWVVLAAVLISGGITAWAMWATGLRGPHESWDQAHGIVEQVWPGEHAADQVQSWMAGDGTQNAARTVAALPGVPSIVWGAQRMHADRGACTNCHAVVTPQGLAIPSIRSFSAMPHEYRGVCINCHQITLGPSPTGIAIATTTTTLGTPNAPAMNATLAAPANPAVAPPPPPKRAPTEAEWKGLEVGPSPQGVTVAGAEGEAGRLGIQLGDVVTSINATAVFGMNDFVQITQNGALPRGTLIVVRAGQRLAFELGQAPQQPLVQTQPPQLALPQLTTPLPPNPASPAAGVGAERRF